MKIAILGASSQIAQDLLRQWAAAEQEYDLYLFARRTSAVESLLQTLSWRGQAFIYHLDNFSLAVDSFDAVLNFIGVGDPSKAREMASSIQQVTFFYDDLAIDYIKNHPQCKYIFLSSGAAYGSDFSQPASTEKRASFDINHVTESENYGLAKFISEVKHRNLQHLPIVDIRVFNFFSRHQDLSARFFVTDLLRAIKNNEECEVSPESMIRDYLHPRDFCQIIECILGSEKINMAVDCYSAAPVDKRSLLIALQECFGLQWRYSESTGVIRATGNKCNYYSEYRVLETLGYKPSFTSLEALMNEFAAVLEHSS